MLADSMHMKRFGCSPNPFQYVGVKTFDGYTFIYIQKNCNFVYELWSLNEVDGKSQTDKRQLLLTDARICSRATRNVYVCGVCIRLFCIAVLRTLRGHSAFGP